MKIKIQEKKQKERQYTWQQMLRCEGLFKNVIRENNIKVYNFLIIHRTAFVVCDNNQMSLLPHETGWKNNNDRFTKVNASVTLEF